MKTLFMTLLVLGSTLLLASEDRGGPRGGGDRQPPQEAIEVCEGQSENSVCEVTTPRGDTLEGTCHTTPDEKYFACRPNNMPRR